MEGLKRDLLIWSSGLFPFFQFAATSVRPILISIYERYYLPLGKYLRPSTKALILALLPGMEEETGDFFDRVRTAERLATFKLIFLGPRASDPRIGRGRPHILLAQHLPRPHIHAFRPAVGVELLITENAQTSRSRRSRH